MKQNIEHSKIIFSESQKQVKIQLQKNGGTNQIDTVNFDKKMENMWKEMVYKKIRHIKT